MTSRIWGGSFCISFSTSTSSSLAIAVSSVLLVTKSLSVISSSCAGSSLPYCQVTSSIFCTKRAGILLNLCSILKIFKPYTSIDFFLIYKCIYYYSKIHKANISYTSFSEMNCANPSAYFSSSKESTSISLSTSCINRLFEIKSSPSSPTLSSISTIR